MFGITQKNILVNSTMKLFSFLWKYWLYIFIPVFICDCSLSYNADRLPLRLVPAFSVLKTFLGYLNTEHYTYGELVNESNIKTGGLSYNASVYKKNYDTDDYTYGLEVKTKVLNNRIAEAFELIEDTLFTSDFNDRKRIKENLEQSKMRIQVYMMQSGHLVLQRNVLPLKRRGMKYHILKI